MTLPVFGIPGNLQRNYATINFIDIHAGDDAFMNMLAIHEHSKTNTEDEINETIEEDVQDSLTEKEQQPEAIQEEENLTEDGGTA